MSNAMSSTGRAACLCTYLFKLSYGFIPIFCFAYFCLLFFFFGRGGGGRITLIAGRMALVRLAKVLSIFSIPPATFDLAQGVQIGVFGDERVGVTG